MKMLNMPDKFPMMYDLSNDVSEENDIALEKKVTADKMIEKLGNWVISCPEPLFFQQNGRQRGIRNMYDEFSPSQPEIEDN